MGPGFDIVAVMETPYRYWVDDKPFTLDIDSERAAASLEVGDDIVTVFGDLISEDDATLMGEDVYDKLASDPFCGPVILRSDVETFRVY